MASLRKLSILRFGGLLCSRRVYPSLQAPSLSRALSYSFYTRLNRLYGQYYRHQYSGYRGYGSTVGSSNRQTFTYMVAIAVAVTGLSYAAVPLYRLYCQASGYGGTVSKATSGDKIEKMEPVEEREVTVKFSSSISSGMRWKFVPQQREIKLLPGETALAFYTATNPTDIPITGIATYNVLPFDAGQYFNKIQCFCFEEQRLNPHEQVDMPVFFYIDPEFVEDPAMINVHTITLSYTLFEAKDSDSIPNVSSNKESL